MAITAMLSIVNCCRVGKDVRIQFSNGKEILFHAQFLWNSRESDGNLEILDSDEMIDFVDPADQRTLRRDQCLVNCELST